MSRETRKREADAMIERHINEVIAKHTDENGNVDIVALRDLHKSWLEDCSACGKSEYSKTARYGKYPCLCWVYAAKLNRKFRFSRKRY